MSQKVFISYAREDSKIANQIYDDLKKAGIEPWIDTQNILPGQNWRTVTLNALRESDYVLILLSSNALSKKGFVQKEIKMAIDILDEFPIDSIFILPVRVDNCKPIDEKLNSLHMVDLFPSYSEGIKRILRVVC